MPDPAAEFIAEVDRAPAAQRPPNWERVKALMGRRAPAVGGVAPDFELATQDGKSRIRRSTFQAGKPLVLNFGSFT
ncbi:MAG: peroxiredoxin family protein [Planctomycetes bacterium]|nr:peroxiredoxin family protein [Planctomycetota bacterium]